MHRHHNGTTSRQYNYQHAIVHNDLVLAVADPGGATGGHAPPPNDGQNFFHT